MIPSLQTFVRALLAPDLSLATLFAAHAEVDAQGLPSLTRTTRFVETQIAWKGEQWLLSMPLTPSALPHIERMASTLHRLNTEWLTPYRILPQELHWCDTSGAEQHCDLVIEQLPAGCDFAEALLREHKQTLLAAVDALQAELQRLQFSHNNLKAANLRWCGGRLIPLRYHDAHIGQAEGRDTEAFDALRREIEAAAGAQEMRDTTVGYQSPRTLSGHRWVSHLFEGLICVEDAQGFGYVDSQNKVAIPAHYLWAGDFREGRAEVQTPTGMGLIDRQGNFVIAPEYEIVDYDPTQSLVHVRQGGRWALFDYLGRRLTEFHEREREEALGLEVYEETI